MQSVNNFGHHKIIEIHEVVVDYNQTVLQMIEACQFESFDLAGGIRAYSQEEISYIIEDLFKINGTGIHKFRLAEIQLDDRDFNTGFQIDSADAIEYLHKIGLVPAKIEHLLAYKKKITKEDYNITALGSCYNGMVTNSLKEEDLYPGIVNNIFVIFLRNEFFTSCSEDERDWLPEFNHFLVIV